MASLSIARPGKVSERQFLGDLAGLFERQRQRSGLALTPGSFASDLGAGDALRSGLFTLCNAISHMGEHDLSPEELLDLVARALCGAASAEGESATSIPTSMRDAFLSGYEAWRNRDLRPIDSSEPEVWPLAPAVRKPPARESNVQAGSEVRVEAAAGGSGPAEPPIPGAGRRTVQEAISLVRREHGGDPDHPGSHPALSGVGSEALGDMTLGELKHFLEDIEDRFSRLGPQIHQLNSAAREPVRRERSKMPPDPVIPFPTRRPPNGEPRENDLRSFDDTEALLHRRPILAPNTRAEDTFLSQTTETDERPRGIDALLAAAPAWASAVPTARTFDEESFLARHAYLSPTRRPGSNAAASVCFAETPAAPLAPPPAALPPTAVAKPVEAAPTAATPTPPVPLIGLDAEDDPLLSPTERLQAYMLQLSPRRVFTVLAGLTILAGGLAGFIAYRTLHSNRVPQFTDLEQAAHFGSPSAAIPMSSVAEAASTEQRAGLAAAVQRPSVVEEKVYAPLASAAKRKSHIASAPGHAPAVAVWPPVPEHIARDTASSVSDSVPPAHSTTAQGAPLGAVYVPAPTMIGYALASPQPAYPAAQARGMSGTVAVDVTISRLGDVVAAHAVSGPQELRPAAVAAVRNWRFRPYLVDGRAVQVSTSLQFFFRGE